MFKLFCGIVLLLFFFCRLVLKFANWNIDCTALMPLAHQSSQSKQRTIRTRVCPRPLFLSSTHTHTQILALVRIAKVEIYY
jgi:hypothetical protein